MNGKIFNVLILCPSQYNVFFSSLSTPVFLYITTQPMIEKFRAAVFNIYLICTEINFLKWSYMQINSLIVSVSELWRRVSWKSVSNAKWFKANNGKTWAPVISLSVVNSMKFSWANWSPEITTTKTRWNIWRTSPKKYESRFKKMIECQWFNLCSICAVFFTISTFILITADYLDCSWYLLNQETDNDRYKSSQYISEIRIMPSWEL